MSWALLAGAVLLLGLVLWLRRAELVRIDASLAERTRARERGSDKARLAYPHVDLSRCIGCGICVEACPEDGVLEVIHGQALVVHGARCVGHGRCAAECPVGAIALTLGDLSQRTDIPVLTDSFESSPGSGIFLAGEVTGYALVRTAIAHGTAVASEVARRKRATNGHVSSSALDLCIVGAGPAGLACALQAKALGLRFVVLEQEGLGGTVSKYPRRKLVMTQPVELPLHGRLERTEYTKEELMELWGAIARTQELPIRTGEVFQGVERAPDGLLAVRTASSAVAARNVCLALGRRGTPRKLGVPGEELPKVAYGLLDARSFDHRRILVVGGGDSAIEAAVGLAEQDGNRVTLSYRKSAFSRLKARNEARIEQARAAGKVEILFESEVREITPEAVTLDVGCDKRSVTLSNDDVFVLAGGVPPFELLQRSGVSFDPSQRAAAEPLADRGTGLARALAVALVLALAALGWTLWQRDYYGLPLTQRPGSPLHELLRPAGRVGLWLGVAALAALFANLAYLLRRARRIRFGSLPAWMTAHVATGIGALLLATVHGAMAPRDTVGGHALIGLAVLVATGAIGRYFYAFVPRAANGRELELEEVRASLAALSAEFERTNRDFGARVQAEVEALVARRWHASFGRRVLALLGSQRELRARLAALREEGRASGVPPDQLRALGTLARRAHRAALMAAHYEDLRGLLASWRYFHRWVALLMVLLVLLHVVTALRYADILPGGVP